MTIQQLMQQHAFHRSEAKKLLQRGLTAGDVALDAHLAAAESLKAQIEAQPVHRHPMVPDAKAGGYEFGGGGSAAVPDHAVKMLGHEQKVADHVGVKRVDEEAAYGYLGMTFKNSVSPQDPDDMARWATAAGLAQKDMATGGSAGTLIPTPIAGFLIDLLRANTVVSRLGAQTVPMQASTIKVNRQTGDVTAGWYAEAGTLTFSDAAFDSVTLTARHLQAGTKISLELAEDSADPVDAGRVVANSIAMAMALELDRVALRGSGTSNQPTGIKNTSGVGTLALGTNGGALTFDSLLTMQSTLAQANVTGTGFVFHPRTAYALAGSKDGQQRYLNPPQAIEQAYGNSQTTSALPTNLTKGTGTQLTEAYAGDWSQVLIGMRVYFTLQTLHELFRGTGQVGLVGRLRADIGVKHATSFVVVSDATN